MPARSICLLGLSILLAAAGAPAAHGASHTISPIRRGVGPAVAAHSHRAIGHGSGPRPAAACRTRTGFVLHEHLRSLRRFSNDRRYASVGQAMFRFDGHGCGHHPRHDVWRG